MPEPTDRWRGSNQLPRGRHGLSRAFVASNQRERIVESLAHTCAVKGYRAVTVEDVISHAGVSRRTFYDLFADKQHCFLCAYDVTMDRLLASVDAAYWAAEEPWPARVVAALSELVSFMAGDPVFARLVMVEVLAAGRPALERRDAALRRFEVYFGPARAVLPPELAQQQLLTRAVIGGISEALYSRVVADELASLPELLPDLAYCALVPYVGHRQATAAVEAYARG